MRTGLVFGFSLLAAAACGSSPPPDAANAEASAHASDEAPLATSAPSAAASAAASADPAPSSQPAAGPAPIIVHRSELYATLIGRAGKTVRMSSLVTTSDTPLAPETKALLMRKVPVGKGEDGGEWSSIAEVVVKKVDAQANIELTITSEQPPDKKGTFWAKGSSVKLRIDR